MPKHITAANKDRNGKRSHGKAIPCVFTVSIDKITADRLAVLR